MSRGQFGRSQARAVTGQRADPGRGSSTPTSGTEHSNRTHRKLSRFLDPGHSSDRKRVERGSTYQKPSGRGAGRNRKQQNSQQSAFGDRLQWSFPRTLPHSPPDTPGSPGRALGGPPGGCPVASFPRDSPDSVERTNVLASGSGIRGVFVRPSVCWVDKRMLPFLASGRPPSTGNSAP